MTIYLFGNKEYDPDKLAFVVAYKLKSIFPEFDFNFIEIKPNQDLPFFNHEHVIMMDAVDGIEKVTLITEKNIDQLILPPRSSAHDYDLAFQLKYLKKLGKLSRYSIIGLPMNNKIDYDSIQLTLRKLVAQDMQGS